MPKLTCLCNESINLSPLPNSNGFVIVWEPMIERFIDDLITAHQQATSNDDFEKQAYNFFHMRNPRFPHIYECPNCGRLAIFARASDAKPVMWFERKQEVMNSLRSVAQGTGGESE